MSETKWQGPYETDSDWSDHGRLYFSRGKEVLYLNNKEDQAKILAALNQPARGGPGLTEEERSEIERAAFGFEGMSGDKIFGPDYARRAAIFRNLLSREGRHGDAHHALAVKLLDHAKKMREWACDRHAFGSMVSEFDGPDDVDASLQVSFDVVAANVAIAEAEAALAKGGEHGT